MSKFTRKQVLLAKQEVTYGVDPTPTGAANAILIRSLTFTPINAQLVQRNLIRPYFGNSPTLLAEMYCTASFEVELAASGTAGTAPGWGPLLKACAFSETVTASTNVIYAPITTGLTSCTLYFYNDGILHKMTGAFGTVEFSVSAKQIPVMKFTFTGIYNSPSDTSNPTATYTAFQQPKVANTTNTTAFSLLSYSGVLESLTLNVANDVQHRALIGADQVVLIDRKPSGTMVIEAPAIASMDYFTAAKNGTLGDMNFTHGNVAGNIVHIDCPNVSIGNPSYQDSQGVQMLSIPYVATPVSGNDEIVITLT